MTKKYLILKGTQARNLIDLCLRAPLVPPAWFSIFVLAVLALFISSCNPVPTPVPTATVTETALPSRTPTAASTSTQTATPTPTPEPAWYQPLDPSFGILKYHYALVNNPKARVYVSVQDAVARTGNFGILPKYPAYVAYTTTEIRDGRTFYLVNYGWMDGIDLQPLTPSTFTGILLTRVVTFRFGWVLSATQSVNAAGTPIQSYARYQLVQEVPAGTQKDGFLAVGADEWLPEEKVALVSPQVPAVAEANTCRFIYVNLAEQTLAVYDDCKLVFATLVSSGANSWTFEGRFAILYKVEYNPITPPPESTSEYYIEAVPYFMSYSGNFGFHGAYWHDNFGSAASHGCINLSPADAKWLYAWAGMGETVIISPGK
jgi:lipoprotein-anchoring transpeptidase ErfK/SrfK